MKYLNSKLLLLVINVIFLIGIAMLGLNILFPLGASNSVDFNLGMMILVVFLQICMFITQFRIFGRKTILVLSNLNILFIIISSIGMLMDNYYIGTLELYITGLVASVFFVVRYCSNKNHNIK